MTRLASCRVIVCDNLITADRRDGLARMGSGFSPDIIRPLKLETVDPSSGRIIALLLPQYPLETLEVATLGTKQMLPTVEAS